LQLLTNKSVVTINIAKTFATIWIAKLLLDAIADRLVQMAPEKIHVLPVGFDIHRLTAPLTSDEFDVDRVVLAHSTEDSIDPEGGYPSETDRMVANAFEKTRDNIENFLDVPVEIRTIPEFTEYRQLYTEAYKSLRRLSSEGVVYVNVSSIPLSAASAFTNAEAVLSAEGTAENSSNSESNFTDEYANRSERVHTYYIRPEQHLEAELIHYNREITTSNIESLEKFVEEYKELESGLFYGLAELIQQRVETLQTLIKRAEQELQTASPEQRGDDWEENIRRCNELLEEWDSLGPAEPSTGPIVRNTEKE
jgi:hypothetical protein